MLVAAAVCPHPPLLVPAVAAGAAGELQPLREAARSALDVLRACAPDLLVVVGAEDTAHHGRTAPPAGREWAAGAVGTLRGVGVAVDVRLGGDQPPEYALPTVPGDRMPLSLTVGAFLLAASGWRPEVAARSLAAEPSAAAHAETGRRLADAADRVGLLVLGDGSACRTEKAPGYFDPRAEAFDAAVTRALSGGDAAGLAAVDGSLARGLHAAGWPAWQCLAGAATGGSWQARLHYADAPYGVGYTVASWVRA